MLPIVFEFSTWVALTPKHSDLALRKRLDKAIKASGHTVLKQSSHKFAPQGLTALWLLSESHFALHTYPEHNMAYIQLSSCNLEYYTDLVDIINASFTTHKTNNHVSNGIDT